MKTFVGFVFPQRSEQRHHLAHLRMLIPDYQRSSVLDLLKFCIIEYIGKNLDFQSRLASKTEIAFQGGAKKSNVGAKNPRLEQILLQDHGGSAPNELKLGGAALGQCKYTFEAF